MSADLLADKSINTAKLVQVVLVALTIVMPTVYMLHTASNERAPTSGRTHVQDVHKLTIVRARSRDALPRFPPEALRPGY